jgi:Ribbon-helix-helix protein, copG family
MTKNSTFKLTDDDLEVLGRLAQEMRCSRTDVIRRALLDLDRARAERRASLDRFVERLFGGVPEGSTLMIGLDDALEPYATIDGREPRPDIGTTGQRVSVGGEDYVRVLLVDPDTDLRLDAGVIKASTGGWLALVQPFPVALAG